MNSGVVVLLGIVLTLIGNSVNGADNNQSIQASGALVTGASRITVMADDPALVRMRELERIRSVVKGASSKMNAAQAEASSKIITLPVDASSKIVNAGAQFQFRDFTERVGNEVSANVLTLAEREAQVELLRGRFVNKP